MISIYKPKERNSVSPYLIVAGANDTIEFLIRVFGATELDDYRMKQAASLTLRCVSTIPSS